MARRKAPAKKQADTPKPAAKQDAALRVCPWETGARVVMRVLRPMIVPSTDNPHLRPPGLTLEVGDRVSVAEDRADRWVRNGKAETV